MISRAQLDLFRQLLDGKLFLASLSHQFAQSNKKILNHIPAQCDNTHPVEIVIHLLKSNNDDTTSNENDNDVNDSFITRRDTDELSEMKDVLNNSVKFLNRINAATQSERENGQENAGGEKTRNLSEILKRFVGNATTQAIQSTGGTAGVNSNGASTNSSASSSPSLVRRASVPNSSYDALILRPLKHADLFVDSNNTVQVSKHSFFIYNFKKFQTQKFSF